MNIPALQPTVDLSAIPVERLAEMKGVSEGEKVEELTRQFEAVLLRQILKNIQKSVIKSEFSDESMHHEVYQDMVTVTLADSLSHAGGLGLANSLQAELTRQVKSGEEKKP